MATRLFQPASDKTPNTNKWHAYHDEGREALCGRVSLNYNRDSIADVVPFGNTVHKACQKRMDEEIAAAKKSDDTAGLRPEDRNPPKPKAKRQK